MKTIVIIILTMSVLAFTVDVIDELVNLGILPADFDPSSTPSGSDIALYIYKLNARFESQIGDLKEQIDSLFNSLSDSVNSLNSEMEGVKKVIEVLEKRDEEFSKDLKELKGEFSEFKDQIHGIYSVFSEFPGFSDLAKTLRKLDARIGILEGKYVDLMSEMEDLKSNKLDELKRKILDVETGLDTRLKKLEYSVESLSKSLKSTIESVKSVNEAITTLNDNDKRIEKALKTLSSNDEILYKNVETLSASIVLLDLRYRALESSVGTIVSNEKTLYDDLVSVQASVLKLERDKVGRKEFLSVKNDVEVFKTVFWATIILSFLVSMTSLIILIIRS